MMKLGRVSKVTMGTPVIQMVEDYDSCLDGQYEIVKPGCGA